MMAGPLILILQIREKRTLMKVRLLMKVKMMRMKGIFSGDLRPKRSSALLSGPKIWWVILF